MTRVRETEKTSLWRKDNKKDRILGEKRLNLHLNFGDFSFYIAKLMSPALGSKNDKE